MTILFWLMLFFILYAYFLYPLLLVFIGKNRQKLTYKTVGDEELPSVAILLPVHNEANVIQAKLENIELLNYPTELLNVVIVSDGSTDNTIEIVENYKSRLNIKVVEVEQQKGKANALNQGLKEVSSSIVIFTDASIMLDKQSIKNIVMPFTVDNIGCVSGEDHIPANQGGEGLYGKYELFLRNKESAIDSIVGASGSFYAQRTSLVKSFKEGLAPDFLSVLYTVEAGFRAITEPKAIGIMSASKSTSNEYNRKVRTILRGMTALFSKLNLLNPIRYGWFSIFLLSHKIMRWLVPFFLIMLFLINIYLLDYDLYRIIFGCQIAFYILAVGAIHENSILHNKSVGKIPLFFTMVNLAILKAWVLYLFGKRQEVWRPTKREHRL
ncbi:glycosyltransferase family 2 protein [Candidatus Thiodiazotropha sp. CDECU1]|uniref:glycosyltransferase family 2 protein n=1 Tax=Candidatus Thiodiazotropha sp. CDECU1 TaxID=3065865 RepID=UPI00293012BC|nr:glycosyltransferase family 2 protein [Candidatus Thiodiazotropha sp. CDECU1]